MSSRTRIGRNDPCWCGSGRKFKHCHLGREDMQRPTAHEVAKDQRKQYDKRYCSHPQASDHECDGNIVKAHTIQRSGLTQIARDGHVYGFSPDLVSLVENAGRFEAKLIGINRASTFTGFCQKHDTETFKAIELYPFEPKPETTFLLAFRSVCKELFAKQIQLESVEILKGLDKGLDQASQYMLYQDRQLYELAVKTSWKEIRGLKDEYDSVLLKGDYSKVRFYSIAIKEVPELMCSGMVDPDFDFEGSKLQDVGDLKAKLETVTFSIIAGNPGGHVVFSWLQDDKGPAQCLLESLNRITDKDLPHAILRFVISCSENVFFAPSWWERLKEDEREKVMTRVMHQTAEPMTVRGPHAFLDDGLRIVSWHILDRITNCTFE